MEGGDETGLLQEIEQLRQELYRLLSGKSCQLNSPKACALSAELDSLIARYMNEKLKPPATGE